MIVAVLIGAYIFMQFLALSRIPFEAGEWIANIGMSRWVFVAIVLILFMVLGTFFDMIAIVSVTTPILFPIMTQTMGFDPLWYGVLMVRVIEAGFVSPPYGINLVAVAGSCGVSMAKVWKGVMPFFIADCANVVLLAAVPVISTFLPGLSP